MRTTLNRDNLLLREFTITGSTVATDKKKKGKNIKFCNYKTHRKNKQTNKQTLINICTNGSCQDYQSDEHNLINSRIFGKIEIT